MTNTKELEKLVARANEGDQEALQQILNPVGRPGLVMPTWADCVRYPDGYHLGRNDLPQALWAAFTSGVLHDPEEVTKGVSQAWTMCEWPLHALDESAWETLFTHTGFLSDATPNQKAAQVDQLDRPATLYRSAHPDYMPGMSWTSDLETAYWFACRNRRFGYLDSSTTAVVKVDTDKCPWWLPLAHFNVRDEHEWVMPWPRRALPREHLSFHELDLLSAKWQREKAA
ncbi:hypothetical protein G7068_03205 [Leucobacter viscericola]|uniref:Uncharacterized protein n=1 Tax=Leucobacter viscericola TaxID=2714935 RepID=A0A6G7XCU2_9MICO|nr:hypothetical protein [Leucobacter viscericola]QIK62322.1 hypothetical protein G7068_03205 [Leucobacter viscericola]